MKKYILLFSLLLFPCTNNALFDNFRKIFTAPATPLQRVQMAAGIFCSLAGQYIAYKGAGCMHKDRILSECITQHRCLDLSKGFDSRNKRGWAVSSVPAAPELLQQMSVTKNRLLVQAVCCWFASLACDYASLHFMKKACKGRDIPFSATKCFVYSNLIKFSVCLRA